MNFFGFSGLVNAITSLIVGIFVLTRNYRDSRYITYSLFCLSIFGWSIFYFFWQIAKDASSALFFTRALNAACIFIPIFYLHHLSTLFELHKNKYKIIILAYIFGVVSFGFVFTSYFVREVAPRLIFPYWPLPGPFLHPFLLIWSLLVVYELYLIVEIYQKSEGLRKNQAKYMLIAGLIGYGGGITNWFLWYDIPVLPYGTISVSAYLLITSYVILRHQFMDINIVFRKTAIYSILATVITVLYFILIYIMEGFFRGFMGYKSIPWTLSVIVIFTLIFQPLKNLIQSFVDKYFFKGSIIQELEKAQEELKRTERLKAVGTLAAGMAHEIKNPLTGIKTFTEHLSAKYMEPGFIEKFERIVGGEVNKINDIVQQLLDFSKPKPLHLEETNIHALIDQTLSFLSNDFIKYDIKVTKNYDASSPLLNIDPNQIKQVFLNLFLNAIDAMKEKGGILTIATKAIDNNIEITIQDTGKGIPKKDLEHIFDPFYTTKETGTGLGMSIVYGIIKEHKGEIKVESEVDKGTTVKIRL